MTTNNFKPILFSTEMVQAILAGRKTQTRRNLNRQPKADEEKYEMKKMDNDGKMYYAMCLKQNIDDFPFHGFFSPKYQPGDILWVRETYIDVGEKADQYFGGVRFHYKANQDFVGCWPWKPSIFMPKEVARIFLKVTNVRCERLQDISENDAIAEGVDNWTFKNMAVPQNFRDYSDTTSPPLCSAYDSFETLWQSINAKKHPWESNPWVWVYEFERIEKPENF